MRARTSPPGDQTLLLQFVHCLGNGDAGGIEVAAEFDLAGQPLAGPYLPDSMAANNSSYTWRCLGVLVGAGRSVAMHASLFPRRRLCQDCCKNKFLKPRKLSIHLSRCEQKYFMSYAKNKTS